MTGPVMYLDGSIEKLMCWHHEVELDEREECPKCNAMASMICQRPGCKQPFRDHDAQGCQLWDCDGFCEVAPPEPLKSFMQYAAECMDRDPRSRRLRAADARADEGTEDLGCQ